MIGELRDSPAAERALLAPDISRVSRKLHLRRTHRTTGAFAAVLLEALAATLGGIFMAAAIGSQGTTLALAGTILWIVSFEPLVKLAAGTALGVEYDYAYLYGGLEPRFKMKYGSYMTMAPLRRVLFQFAGTLGSPLGALIAAELCEPELPTASAIAWGAFWLLLLINVGGVVTELAGIRRIGRLRFPPGSANEMVVELQCWWRHRGARAS